MKKLYSLLAIALLSMGAIAQDFSVEEIIIRSKVDTGWAKIENDTVITGDTVHLGVLFYNAAGGVVSTTDSIAFGVSVAGLPAGSYGAEPGKNLPAGSGSFSRKEMIINKSQVFNTSAANIEVCAWPIFWSKGGLGGSTSNDTACATYTVWDRVITVKNFTPLEGKAGVDVTINGSYFGAGVASNVVKFGGETATIKTASATQIVATVPATGVSGKITVESAGLTGTSTEDFTVLGADGAPVFPTSISELKNISAFIGIKNNQLMLNTGTQNRSISIIDLTGKVVHIEADLTLNEVVSIDLSHLHEGVYIATYGQEYLKFSK